MKLEQMPMKRFAIFYNGKRIGWNNARTPLEAREAAIRDNPNHAVELFRVQWDPEKVRTPAAEAPVVNSLPTNLELRPVFSDVTGLYNGRPIHVATIQHHEIARTPNHPLGLKDARRVAAKLALAYNSHDALVKALNDLSAVVMDWRTTGKPDLGRMAEATDNAVNLLAQMAHAGATNALEG